MCEITRRNKDWKWAKSIRDQLNDRKKIDGIFKGRVLCVGDYGKLLHFLWGPQFMNYSAKMKQGQN